MLTVPGTVTFVTPVPFITGLLFVDVTLYTKPCSVIDAPPFAVIDPFSVAPEDVTDVAAEEVTVGAFADAFKVVKVSTAPYSVPTLVVTYALK